MYNDVKARVVRLGGGYGLWAGFGFSPIIFRSVEILRCLGYHCFKTNAYFSFQTILESILDQSKKSRFFAKVAAGHSSKPSMKQFVESRLNSIESIVRMEDYILTVHISGFPVQVIWHKTLSGPQLYVEFAIRAISDDTMRVPKKRKQICRR